MPQNVNLNQQQDFSLFA